MPLEDDILKTLMRIEKLLSSSAQSSGFGGSTSGGRAASAATRRAQTQTRGDQKTFQATSKSLSFLGDRADDVGRRLGKLSKTVYATQGQFVALNKSMRVFSRATPQTAFNSGGARATTGTGNGPLSAPGPANRQLGGLTKGLSVAKTGLIDFALQLGSAIKPLYNDFYRLQAIGIDAGSSLLGLYGDAIKAGMGLEEYTKTLQENGPAVVRAGSFDEFGKSLESTRAGLNRLGVFGADATKLSASLANSATTLGVPQSQLADATRRQVSVFDDLRKTSMITADQFAELNKELAGNENVQGELLGLSGSERAARMEELQRINAIGYSMGMTTEASKKLGNALLEQRKLTTVQRFQTAGAVRQAGAVLGMSSGDTEELARLQMKKNRSGAEAARFVELGGQMQQRLEQFQNSEDPNRQFIADQFSDRLAPMASQLAAAGEARLVAESGGINNKDIGKYTSDTAIAVKNIETWLKALGSNPIYSAVTAALGSAAFTLALGAGLRGGLGPLSNIVMKAVGLKGGAGVAGAAGGGLWQGAKNMGARGLQMLGIGPKLVGPTMPKPSLAYRAGNALGRGAGNIANVAGDALGLAKSMPRFLLGMLKRVPVISFLVDAIGEAFTGNIAAAFGPNANWAERIGNAVYAGVTGLVGGIVSMVDSIGEFFGLPENFFRNKFDIFTSYVRGQFFSMLAGMAKMVTFGSDNKVSKYFQESADGAFKVVDELVENSTATVNSIGQKNKAMLADQEKAAKGALDSTSKVINSTKGLAGVGVMTAQGVAIATPGATNRASVSQAEVNTPANQTTNAGATATAGTNTGNPAQPTDTLTAQVTQIIALLQSMLTAEQNQTLALQLLRGGRPAFSDTERNSNTLLASD